MKGLLKYLSPFAPDQSGAASVLYELGGITVICDAGGCTGNICGFDEPRWFMKKSAIFSAGLRDMDAILGRDDQLIEKLKDVANKVDAEFAAMIGTPVPAVIATDYKALARLAEKRCGLPTITLECTGTRLYDEGEEKAYLALVQKFVKEPETKDKQTIGVFGMTPLDISCLDGKQRIEERLINQGWEKIFCYGMESGLDTLKIASAVTRNVVVSPAGIKAAQYLQERYQIPFDIAYPFLPKNLLERLQKIEGKHILIIHQQFAANEIRKQIRTVNKAEVVVATFFILKDEWKEKDDVSLSTEDELIQLVEENSYDTVIGDKRFQRALRTFHGEFIEFPHFAVSGELLR